jgi:hypothetical protein
MAGYTRQSTFADGDTITAALFNNEYNQLVNAFSNTTGHSHDGTAASGPVIGLIGDAGETSPNNKVVIDTTNNYIEFYVEVSSAPVQQLYIADGAIIPVTDSDIDLGTTSLRFKDTYTDTITTTGNATIGGNLTVTGNATISGNLTFGDADTDSINLAAEIDSNIVPNTDDTYDLGTSTKQWKDLYIDGTANIDSLVADTADINGGTIDGATIATSDITVGAGKTLDVSSGTLTLADDQISGDKVEGGTIAATTITTLTSTTGNITNVNATTLDTTNIEVTNLKAKDGTAAGSIADSTGVVTLGSSVLTTTDINGGTIDGTTIATSDITVGTGKTLNVSAGTLTLADNQISGDKVEGGTIAATTITDLTFGSLNDGSITITAFVDEDDMTSNSATLVPTQQSVKAYVDSQVTAQDLDFQGDTGGALSIDLDSESLTIAGGTGLDTVGSGNTITVNIDSTVATLTGTQTLTNKTLTTPVISSISNTGTITLPTSTDTLVGRATTDTLTNKTIDAASNTLSNIANSSLTNSTVSYGGVSLALGASDATPAFDLSDATNYPTSSLTGTITNAQLAGSIAVSKTLLTAGTGLTLSTNTLSVDAAQTQITSVGTLGSLTVSGDLTVDTSTLKIDSTNNRVGIGNATPDVSLDLGSNTDAIHVPVGNTAARPGSPAAGYFRYNSETNKFEGYTTEWGAIAGGGSGTNMDTNIYAGDGSTVNFTLSTAPDTEQNLMVFIDGVFQAHDSYSVSGTTLTFSTAPASGRVITAYHSTTTVGGSNYSIATMTGDGSDTTLTLSTAPVHENNVQVYFDGVYQSKSNYSISGTTVTFTTAPPSGVTVEAITATNTSITTATQLVDADSDTMIQVEESSDEDKIRFDTGGTERMIIDSTGVGIGTSSPDVNLEIATSTSDTGVDLKLNGNKSSNGAVGSIIFENASDSVAMIRASRVGGNNDAADMQFFTQATGGSNTERLRIDSSGNVGIGNSSPQTKLFVGSGSGTEGITIYSGTTGEGQLRFADGTSGSSLYQGRIEYNHSTNKLFLGAGGTTPVAIDSSGNVGIGAAPVAAEGVFLQTGNNTISQRGFSTNIYYDGSNYRAINTGGSTLIQGGDNHLFYTAASASAGATQTPVERMRIDSSGKILMNTTTQLDTVVLTLGGVSSAKNGLAIVNSADTGTIYSIYFRAASGALIGSITNNGSNVTYSTSSDARLKDVTGEAKGLEVINALNPVSYNWKESGQADEGLIAQEVKEIVPNAVTGSEEEMYQMDYSKLVTPLIKAVQELSAEVEELKKQLENK